MGHRCGTWHFESEREGRQVDRVYPQHRSEKFEAHFPYQISSGERAVEGGGDFLCVD